MSDILDHFRADARSKRGRLMEIATASGIKPKTLRNLIYVTTNPRYQTVEKLRAYYSSQLSA